MMSAAVPIAQSGISAIERTANVPVIGWSRKKIRHNKKQDVITEESIQVRAWELGVVALGLAVYEYVKGGQSPGSISQGSTLPGWLQSLENFNQGGTLIKW
jgi:hypothetical protein